MKSNFIWRLAVEQFIK